MFRTCFAVQSFANFCKLILTWMKIILFPYRLLMVFLMCGMLKVGNFAVTFKYDGNTRKTLYYRSQSHPRREAYYFTYIQS